MITVLLIRHGIAEDAKSPDSERALTLEGWEKTRAAMRGLVQRGYLPTRGISSPYRRAAETLICLKEATATGFSLGYCDILKPGTPPAKVETWLRGELADATEDSVLALVSHEPLLSSLVHHLTRRSLEVKKASCTVLHWDGQGFEMAVHFTPAELREA
jgi:phosphohistidine phosphatase